eukprot:4014076-Amphidinium_carterae.1
MRQANDNHVMGNITYCIAQIDDNLHGLILFASGCSLGGSCTHASPCLRFLGDGAHRLPPGHCRLQKRPSREDPPQDAPQEVAPNKITQHASCVHCHNWQAKNPGFSAVFAFHWAEGIVVRSSAIQCHLCQVAWLRTDYLVVLVKLNLEPALVFQEANDGTNL